MRTHRVTLLKRALSPPEKQMKESAASGRFLASLERKEKTTHTSSSCVHNVLFEKKAGRASSTRRGTQFSLLKHVWYGPAQPEEQWCIRGHLSSLFCFPMLWVMLWVKVKSHAGIAGNECADAIANDQASQANKKCG
eukprot:1143992-Pelagomonas_calceolata.AAC.3